MEEPKNTQQLNKVELTGTPKKTEPVLTRRNELTAESNPAVSKNNAAVTGSNTAASGSNTATTSKGTSSAKSKGKKKKDKEKSRTIRMIVIFSLAALIVLGIYIRMTNKSKNSETSSDEGLTELEMLEQYDMDKNYPKNARDVAKMHCRILKTMYNDDLDDSDYQTLNQQARCLYSSELLELNPEATQYASMMEEVEEFKSDNKIYISYTIEKEENVTYSTMDGKDYAIVDVSCDIKQSTVTSTLTEEYLLCKEDEEWKIVGWQGVTIDPNATTTEESE